MTVVDLISGRLTLISAGPSSNQRGMITMAGLNKGGTKRQRPVAASPIKTKAKGLTTTHEGGEGFTRTAKSDLFLMSVGSFHGEGTFYESATGRNDRFNALVRKVTAKDPAWVRAFLPWLRGPEANIRTAALVGAVEYVMARLEAGEDGDNRRVIDQVIQRLDEAGEIVQYTLKTYGRLPKPIKRGVGDAVIRLGSEYAFSKYGRSDGDAVKLADVLALTHPGDRKGSAQTVKGFQHDLFELATSSPYRDVEPGESLTMLRARQSLMAVPVAQRRAVVLNEPERLAEAGVTWEALAGWLQGPMDAKAWEAVIPSMGVMALIRNLRNFDEAKIGKAAVAKVVAKISDPAVVAASRQLPFRWLAAYNAVSSDRYRVALGDAVEASTANIPDFPGTTLALTDCSASMGNPMSGKSKMAMVDAAGLFGSALAARLGDRVDLVAYGTYSTLHRLPRGGSVLAHARTFRNMGSVVGHGTNTWEAVAKHYDGHDRVLIFTDGQTRGSGHGMATRKARIYAWNLAGYATAMVPSGRKGQTQEVGGLSDATFKLLPLMERGQDSAWPWEM